MLSILALAASIASTLAAQKPAPVAPSPVASSPTALPLPPQSSTSPIDQSPESNRPIFLSGTVVIGDGGGPASNVAIKRVCQGIVPRTVAWTNANGQFSLQWNSVNAVVPDASDSGPFTAAPSRSGNDLTRLDMTGCELQVDAPGFRADRVELTGHRALDNPDLGTIVLHRIGNASDGLSVSATTLMAPHEAKKAWEKGMQLLRAQPTPDPAGAEREFERAVRIYPKYAEAWLFLGWARQRQEKEDLAREAFLKAIEADDRRVEPFIELGLIATRRQEWPEAARYLDRALQLDPVGFPHLWYDDAEADYHVRSLDRAEKNVREALSVAAPDREPRATRLLGLVLLSKGDYAGAEAALRTYLRDSPDVEDWDDINGKLVEIRRHLRADPATSHDNYISR